MQSRLKKRFELGAWFLVSVGLGLGPSEGMTSDVDSELMVTAHNHVLAAVEVEPQPF